MVVSFVHFAEMPLIVSMGSHYGRFWRSMGYQTLLWLLRIISRWIEACKWKGVIGNGLRWWQDCNNNRCKRRWQRQKIGCVWMLVHTTLHRLSQQSWASTPSRVGNSSCWTHWWLAGGRKGLAVLNHKSTNVPWTSTINLVAPCKPGMQNHGGNLLAEHSVVRSEQHLCIMHIGSCQFRCKSPVGLYNTVSVYKSRAEVQKVSHVVYCVHLSKRFISAMMTSHICGLSLRSPQFLSPPWLCFLCMLRGHYMLKTWNIHFPWTYYPDISPQIPPQTFPPFLQDIAHFPLFCVVHYK